MVGEIASVCGLCICAALLCKITEKHSKEQSVLLVITVTAVIFLNAVDSVPGLLDKMDILMAYSGLEREYLSIIFKSLGICWLTQFSSDICRDCNEAAIASAAEIFGKIQLAVLSLPLFDGLIDIVTEILE
ncbi:MAG: hypothetical protein NC320_05475 [Clostridium sp.]|nr:hypothetical protein [Clostridium sp.]